MIYQEHVACEAQPSDHDCNATCLWFEHVSATACAQKGVLLHLETRRKAYNGAHNDLGDDYARQALTTRG